MAFWICFAIVGMVFVYLHVSTKDKTPPPAMHQQDEGDGIVFFEDHGEPLDTYIMPDDDDDADPEAAFLRQMREDNSEA